MKAINTLLAVICLALVATQLSCSINQYCVGCDTGDAGSGNDDAGTDGNGSADAMVDAGCVPTGTEVCDSVDNDCNGLVDDGVLPQVGDLCTNQQGACAGGTLACTNGALKCSKPAMPETCDGIDNNCDGVVDDGDPGGGAKCGTDAGECVAGVYHCDAATGTLQCYGFQDHRNDPELCDGKDNDCDGNFDEGIGSLGTCGPTTDDGQCTFGSLMCVAGVAQCQGAVFPTFEVCNNLDDDCDTLTDELFDKTTDPLNCGTCGNVCPTASKTCYGAATASVNSTTCTTSSTCDGGTCAINSQARCVPSGSTGSCTYQCNAGFIDLDGQAANGCEYRCFPTGNEECDGIDNDCNGQIDEGLTPPPLCLSGGECGVVAPTATCQGAMGWKCTYPGTVQFPETLCDGKDNDCNGNIDENQPNLGQACDDGGVGVCRGTGAYACNTNAPNGPATCVITTPGTTQSAESCDDKDNDCDGKTDEGSETGNLLGQEWVTIGGGRQIMKYEATKPDASGTQQGTRTTTIVSPLAASPTGATASGTTATFTTLTPHGLTVGTKIQVTGVAVSGYNGLWTIATVPSTTTFTVTVKTSGLAASGNGIVSKFIGACSRPGGLPWTNVTYPEALAVCESMGASLCSETRWHQACGVVAPTTYPITVNGTSGTRIEAEDFLANVSAGGAETVCGPNVDDDGDGFVNDGCPAFVSGGGSETGTQCSNNTDDDGDGRVNDGCPTQESGGESGTQCNNNTDDDGDGRVNDGCAAVQEDGETGSQCNNNNDDDGDGRVNDGCPFVEVGAGPESGTQCNNNNDDDGDGRVNDGCPINTGNNSGAESGTQCNNNNDDDGDGRVNDGCAAVTLGAGAESGTQCSNNNDDDGDGRVNDGCPIVTSGVGPETGNQCNNNTDDDADGRVNDGCAAVIVGAGPETNCTNATDDDNDGFINDGCPSFTGGAETGTQCTNTTDDDGDGLVNDGCPTIGPQAWVEDYTPDVNGVPTHSGIANMRALSNIGASVTLAGALTSSPRMDYRITIPTTATDWRIYVRLYSATGNDNTVHYSVSTSTTPVAPTATLTTTADGAWQWISTPALSLTAGDQFLRLFMAEDGIKVDAIFIVRGTTTQPPTTLNSAGANWSYATNPTTYQPTTCNGADQNAANDNVFATGSLASCFADHTAGDVFDMSGNVKEWTLARAPGENPIRGGASNDLATGISCPLNFTLATDTFFFPNVGFRCCR